MQWGVLTQGRPQSGCFRITMAAMQNSRHQLEMVFDIDPQMPSILIGDAEKISHVLKILMENSIKFTEEGGINLCVGFRPESYGITGRK